MKKTSKLSLVLVVALLMTSCGAKLALTREHFTVTPETLEAVGGKIDVAIDGVIPAKMFPAKGLVTIVPVIKYEGGEVEGTSVTLQGEKAVGNNKVIPTKDGGSFNLKASFDYIPEMERCELYARVKVNDGKKDLEHPDVKLADGCVATESLAKAEGVAPAASADAFQRVIQEVTEAQIMFLIQQSNVRSSELKNEEVKALAAAIAAAAQTENKEINNIKISSYASPDGKTDLNEKLADQREKNTEKYLNRELKKAKTQGAIEGEFTAEDWEGFQALLEASSIQDKDLILRVLSMYSDPEQREAEIKNLAAAYKELAKDILPQLRRSKLALTVDVIGKSDEEIKSLYESDATQLSLEELLYTATLYTEQADKEAVYNKAIELFPEDYRAYNNIGSFRFAEGKIAEAKASCEQAYTKKDAPEVCLNLALCAISEGADNATIEQYLNKANGAENYADALGLLYIKKGQYADAEKAFGDTKSNNAALAQMLNKNYEKAKATLAAVEDKDAETYYFEALIGAKTNDKAAVVAGLKKAVAEDEAIKAKASKDVELAKFTTDQEVADILK